MTGTCTRHSSEPSLAEVNQASSIARVGPDTEWRTAPLQRPGTE